MLNNDENFVTWEGLLNYGVQFYRAYKEIKRDISMPFYPVNYYLLGHSLELLLKGKLRKAGLGVVELQKHSHNLDELIKEIEERELFVISKEYKKTISLFNKYYNGKELEYFGSQGLELPIIQEIEIIVLDCAKLCGVADEAFT